MKAKRSVLATLLFCLFIGVSAQAQERRLTMTLLPAEEKPLSTDDLLWIQTNPAKDVYLQFDLSGLPQGLQRASFVRCTLRLIAEDVTYVPSDNPDSGGQLVIVKGQMASDNTKDVVSLSTLSATKNNTVALGETNDLADKVSEKYHGDKKISFRLYSVSNKASSLFYSTKNFGTQASNKPRLVIEYTLGPPDLLESASWSQHQQSPEHTGRSPWIPFRAPNGFSLATVSLPTINGAAAVVDYPLIYEGNIYLISHVLDGNFLFSLDFKGVERWRAEVGKGVVQRSPVISRKGILYVVTEHQIAGYDLTQSGKLYASYSLSGNKLSAYTGVTQGNDGSLFLAMLENDQNFIYGFTSGLVPFLKAGPFGIGQGKISTVTVSPDGRKIFAQIPKGAVVINVANPSEQQTITLENGTNHPLEYYDVPVAGPAGDIMIFSDFTSKANEGNIWDYSPTQRIWNSSGTLLPQPVLGSNGLVYYIQGGALHSHPYDQRGSAETAGTGLNTTSNLVMDGADNIYFWDSGDLQGYSKERRSLFDKVHLTGLTNERAADAEEAPDPDNPGAAKKAGRNFSGPEQFIRLMLGPDGTLWANNKNADALYAFKPSYNDADLKREQTDIGTQTVLELGQIDIRTQTVYRATNRLRVGGVTVSSGTQLLFQAQNGIGFAPGFEVEKGASILARAGF